MTNRPNTDDLRIDTIKELIAPADLLSELPLSDAVATTVSEARHAIHNILHDQDDRVLAVVGPCSVHDPIAARN